ncbi:isochorismatase family cysteine hydrolase [Tersicoccus sp. MR15.9]|uniref:cysteine hydrolase family protein n=1 Tax=Tersicoccus mangrovi TaxID=3121635 RepID=UPI002FE6966E
MTDPRPVLLAMDFQHGIVERLGDDAVLAGARKAVEAARAASIPVVWVRVAFRPGYPEVSASSSFAGLVGSAGDAMTMDHPATAIHAALGPREDEPVVVKRRISAFTGSDLAVVLRAARADTLVLAGISTSGVVLSTLRQAADLDYRLVVLSDACADREAEVHRVLLEKVFPRQAEVTTVADWAGTLTTAP